MRLGGFFFSETRRTVGTRALRFCGLVMHGLEKGNNCIIWYYLFTRAAVCYMHTEQRSVSVLGFLTMICFTPCFWVAMVNAYP